MNLRVAEILLILMIISIPGVLASSITPTLVKNFKSGNAEYECKQFGNYDYCYKFEDLDKKNLPYSLSETVGGVNITINSKDGKCFNWTANQSIIATVIVKGGNNANVYNYTIPTSSDTILCSPKNHGGKIADISHVTFCLKEKKSIPELTPFGLIISLTAILLVLIKTNRV